MACDLILLDVHAGRWPCGIGGDVHWLDCDVCDAPPWPASAGPARRAMFTGTPGPDRFAPDPRAWLGAAREDLAERLADMPPDILLRPHHAHVLSDVPGTRSMLESRGPRGVALDIAALLAPSMLADPEEHLDRILHGLGPLAGALLLSDAAMDDDGHTRACTCGDGLVPGDVLGRAIEQWLLPGLPAEVPLAVHAPGIDEAARWLGWLS